MKKIYLFMLLAAAISFAVTGCDKDNDEPAPEPEEEQYPKDSGTAEGGHSYSWYFDENGIYIDATVSLAGAADNWGVFYFTISPDVVDEYIGQSVAETTIENFYPVEPDGVADTTWTSYAPGQWIDADGYASDWSAGKCFWQYHVYAASKDQYYDIDVPGAVYIGQCPGAPVAGETYISKAKLCGKDWVVSIKFVE